MENSVVMGTYEKISVTFSLTCRLKNLEMEKNHEPITANNTDRNRPLHGL